MELDGRCRLVSFVAIIIVAPFRLKGLDPVEAGLGTETTHTNHSAPFGLAPMEARFHLPQPSALSRQRSFGI